MKCVICDIDGTVSLIGDRSPYEYDKCHLDTLNKPIGKLVMLLSTKYKIIFLSGREDTCADKTTEFLTKHFKNMKWLLLMRAAGDYRKDAIVKRELYEKHIKDEYEVEFVIDDRNQVVDMWRNELNLTCLQVNYGDF